MIKLLFRLILCYASSLGKRDRQSTTKVCVSQNYLKRAGHVAWSEKCAPIRIYLLHQQMEERLEMFVLNLSCTWFLARVDHSLAICSVACCCPNKNKTPETWSENQKTFFNSYAHSHDIVVSWLPRLTLVRTKRV